MGESETDFDPMGRFSVIKGYSAQCGVSVITTEREDSDFDYLEVKVDYSTGNPELPSSFGGFSGGGLWQVPLEKNQKVK